jgi:hypothetical protein
LDNTALHEAAHVDQIMIANREPFFDPLHRAVRSPLQLCPTPPCGWAFFDGGRRIPRGSAAWNRFHDGNSNGRYDGIEVLPGSFVCLPPDCLDVHLDFDEDAIPDSIDEDDTRDTFEEFAETHELCEADAFLADDWACPGRNAGRAPVSADPAACL